MEEKRKSETPKRTEDTEKQDLMDRMDSCLRRNEGGSERGSNEGRSERKLNEGGSRAGARRTDRERRNSNQAFCWILR